MRIRLIDVPMDFGANRRGVDMGPSALRQAGVKTTLSELGHQVEEEKRSVRVPIADHSVEGDPMVKFLAPIVEGCTALASLVEEAADQGVFPLVMGGDHSIAVGTLAGWETTSESPPKTGEWFGSMPTPTSTLPKPRRREISTE